jgi:UDP-N-acetylglucosamine--N-acetylmuramyl-(pentapeptide) pyrophosphoryl-undecaprenol N-acetylglucosamine transferase
MSQVNETAKEIIVFTGGHHNSALSIAQELVRKDVAEIIWYGHKHTMKGDKSLSAEFTEVSSTGIKFRELKAGKLYRTYNPLHWLKIPLGLIQAFWYLLIDRPSLIFSFGGYLAAPVVCAGWVLGIKVVTHEQTTAVGFANKFIALFANRIFVTWPQSKSYFPQDRVEITGLPLRRELFKNSATKKLFSTSLPVLYVTGGKQGSHVINEAIAGILEDLLQDFNIVHQCGVNTEHNDLERFQKMRAELPEHLKDRYIVKGYYYLDEIGQVFHEADFIISRAGAHTVYEIAALAKPAIFIPISWVSHNEQYKNARILVNEGSAVILPDNRLTPVTLKAEINAMRDSLDRYQESAKRASSIIIPNAQERIIDAVTSILQTK